MTQPERRKYLLSALLAEEPQYAGMRIPLTADGQKKLLRSLMNVRPAKQNDAEFLRVQDEYLREAIREKGITSVDNLTPVRGSLYLWQGDITTLAADGIVNAANSGMTGCYSPCHNCIDNCIHTYAGVQLRYDCAVMMREQGHEEPTGQAKITRAYNLPAKYVLHTVGPIVGGGIPDTEDKRLLASCYVSCLDLAAEYGLESLAFCCISTGVFGYPAEDAAAVAVDTVERWLREHDSKMKVIFNVFKDSDLRIYQTILGQKGRT